MDDEELERQRHQACDILEYWRLLDFLEQNDWPHFPNSAPPRGAKYAERHVELTARDIAAGVAADAEVLACGNARNRLSASGFAEHGGYTVYVGKFSRERVASAIASRLTSDGLDTRTETQAGSIAAATFRMDESGCYIAGSLEMSPLVWSLHKLENGASGQRATQTLSQDAYERDTEKMVASCFGTDDSVAVRAASVEKLAAFMNRIVGTTGDLRDEEDGALASVRCRAYRDERAKADDADEQQGIVLRSAFFENDLERARDLLAHATREQLRGELAGLLSYVTAHVDTRTGSLARARLDVLYDDGIAEERARLRHFYASVLQPGRVPLGKWPSGYTPALMQQLAINMIAEPQDDEFPAPDVMSVNGPPGTGKTTLLKDVVAAYIVEKARLLCSYEVPDDAFEQRNFLTGPYKDHGHLHDAPHFYALKDTRIAAYGILVCSTNNKAVENITRELPQLDTIAATLDTSDDEQAAVLALFDPAQSERCIDWDGRGRAKDEPDVYFTGPAGKLFAASDEHDQDAADDTIWGLVAAPLGNTNNVRTFAKTALYALAMSSGKTRANHFAHAKRRFVAQLTRVERMREERARQHGRALELEENAAEHERLAAELEALANTQRDERASQTLLPRIRHALRADAQHDERTPQTAEREPAAQAAHLRDVVAQEREQAAELYAAEHADENGRHTAVDDALLAALLGEGDEDARRLAHVSNPYADAAFDREREKLFAYALAVTEGFVLDSACCQANFKNLYGMWRAQAPNRSHDAYEPTSEERALAMPALLQTLSVAVPVLSSTFASVGRLLEDVHEPGSLGLLVIDEAGQAEPHAAVGALMRCSRALVVGDPMQVQPVVTDGLDCVTDRYDVDAVYPYKRKTLSVQELADAQNPYGTWLDDETWVGCPLVVHRRCDSPMFELSNAIAYGNTMCLAPERVHAPKQDARFYRESSCWFNIAGQTVQGRKNYFVEAQGAKVLEIVQHAFDALEGEPGVPSLFIITPFRSVAYGVRNYIRPRLRGADEQAAARFFDSRDGNIGTVHTFQGKEADEVVLLLGADDYTPNGAIEFFVTSNIVNVAVSRARHRLYVVGDRNVWENNEHVSVLAEFFDTWWLTLYERAQACEDAQQRDELLQQARLAAPSMEAFAQAGAGADDDAPDGAQRRASDSNLANVQAYLSGLPAFGLSDELCARFGFVSREAFEQTFGASRLALAHTALVQGILIYTLFDLDDESTQWDGSFCINQFGRAAENVLRSVYLSELARANPGCEVPGLRLDGGMQATLGTLRESEWVSLATVAELIRKNASLLGALTAQADARYDEAWWLAFYDDIDAFRALRNDASHGMQAPAASSSPLSQAQQVKLILFGTGEEGSHGVISEPHAGRLLHDAVRDKDVLAAAKAAVAEA